ncbi:MAG: cysteine hydrolase [Phyllobacterium sp.]|uniref:cysteine hydrolase family protein n=1 Tax=Phyllobacterium sp. TaxID=1871046 RepID=UPI0030F342CC
MTSGLRFGPICEAAHICVDMQGLFTGNSPWAMPWFERVLPHVHALVAPHPARTIFTRFIPAKRPQSAGGSWQRYYKRWREMTLSVIDERKIDLVPELARYAPPARLWDKRAYSPWHGGQLARVLGDAAIGTLIVSGGETDVCVLATVLGGVDYGYRMIIATDAVCSSSDQAHDAMQLFYGQRLSQQVETAETTEILDAWRWED